MAPPEVYQQLQNRAGFGDDRDLMPYLRERYGNDEARSFSDGVTDDVDRLCGERLGSMARRAPTSVAAQVRARIWQDERPRLILLHMPDALFATAIEAACEHLPYSYDLYRDSAAPAPDPYVNEVFEQQGIPYRLTADGLVEWVGDEALHALAIAPALAGLSDPQFDTAREDFGHALDNVRRGTAKARKDAVNDATKALEGAMLAVLEANAEDLPERRQVGKLWEALRDSGLVPQELMETLTAGSKVSNARGRHTNPEPVTQAEAEASVAAVATAITYLASRLP